MIWSRFTKESTENMALQESRVDNENKMSATHHLCIFDEQNQLIRVDPDMNRNMQPTPIHLRHSTANVTLATCGAQPFGTARRQTRAL